MSILEILQSQLGGNNLSKMSQSLGADEKTTSNAISAALPTLLGALARNSASPKGAESLHSALNNDHDGSILDNLGGLLGGSESGAGSAILGHIFGGQQGRVERGLSQSSGIDAGGISKLMAMLAPMVMGALGQQQKKGGLDAGGLAGLLGQERKNVEAQAPSQMGMLNSLLDADGDGDVDMADLASKGMGLLGGLLGGKR